MPYQFIAAEIYQNTGVITLNRPQFLNAFNEQLIQELSEQIYTFENDEEIKVIVLSGSDKAFAAGIDTREMAERIREGTFTPENYDMIFGVLKNCKKPVLAAISGYALGIGCELALACDIIIAADNANFGLPEITLGLIPCFGGISRLLQAIGKAQTLDMLLSGKALTAEEAFSLGLISRIVPLKDLQQETLALAEKISSMPQQATAAVKECCRFAMTNPLAGGIAFEKQYGKLLRESSDFLEKLDNFQDEHTENT